jgi:hypothetical protein
MDEMDATENNDLKICLISRVIARLNYRVIMMIHRTACETIINKRVCQNSGTPSSRLLVSIS